MIDVKFAVLGAAVPIITVDDQRLVVVSASYHYDTGTEASPGSSEITVSGYLGGFTAEEGPIVRTFSGDLKTGMFKEITEVEQNDSI